MQVIAPNWQKKIEDRIAAYDKASSGNLYTAFNGIEVMDDDFLHACILLVDEVDRNYGSPSGFENVLSAIFKNSAAEKQTAMDAVAPVSAEASIDDKDVFAKADYIAKTYRSYVQNPSTAPTAPRRQLAWN